MSFILPLNSSNKCEQDGKSRKARTESWCLSGTGGQAYVILSQPFKYAHICFLFLDHITNFQLFFEFEMKATLVDDRRLPHNQQQHNHNTP